MSAFLTRDDLRRLTGRSRYSAQRRALDRLGIGYRLADTGEPMVSVDALDLSAARARNSGPRWDRIRAGAR